MGVEFELKYAASPQQIEKIREAYPLAYATIRMRTTYYDTADGDLSARRITLRLRQENDVTVCTVKTPVSTLGRGEWECRCEDIVQGIKELCKLGGPEELLALTAAGVQPVCGAAFTRRAGIVEFLGTKLELALDEGKLLGGGRERPLCEVEVELKDGTPQAAMAFGLELAHAFGLQPEEKSKFRRALALAQGE